MFLIRFVLPLVAFLVIRYLVKSIWGAYRSTAVEAGEKDTGVRTGGDLKRDPVCGTYVAASASVTRVIEGKTLHFCSKTCRDKYAAA